MFRFVKNVISASVIVIIDVCVCVKAIKNKKIKKKNNQVVAYGQTSTSIAHELKEVVNVYT